MGLIVKLYRDSYRCDLNVFDKVEGVTVVNIEGPFKPNEKYPAAVLTTNALGDPIIAPEGPTPANCVPAMFGGTYAATSDGRFSKAVGLYGAIPVHDRVETWDQFAEFSA